MKPAIALWQRVSIERDVSAILSEDFHLPMLEHLQGKVAFTGARADFIARLSGSNAAACR